MTSINLILLNKGSDGEIYSLDNDKIVKVINLDYLNLIEIEILTILNNIYISKATKIIIENYKINIFQKKADYDLNILININMKKKNYFNIERKIKYIRQLVHGVYYLNSKNIIHGDIKPSNILIYNDILKLNDFSMSRNLNNPIHIGRRKLYTLGYRPPECDLDSYNIRSDIWAIGCTIYEIYYGKKYFKFDNSKTHYHLRDINENKPENKFISKLIKNTIVIDPDKRMTIEELYNNFI